MSRERCVVVWDHLTLACARVAHDNLPCYFPLNTPTFPLCSTINSLSLFPLLAPGSAVRPESSPDRMRPDTLLAALPLAPSFNFSSACSLSALSSIQSHLDLPTRFFQAKVLPAGTNLSFPDTDPSCGPTPLIVPSDICRITMQVETSTTSRINMEAWLPRNWTGRFLSTGNGGLGGCISYSDMAYTTSLGFASVGANNGHNGTSGAPFAESPQVVADFAYRSWVVHLFCAIDHALKKFRLLLLGYIPALLSERRLRKSSMERDIQSRTTLVVRLVEGRG